MDFSILVPTEFEAKLVADNIKAKSNFIISGILKQTTNKITELIDRDRVKKIVLLGFAGDLREQKRVGKIFNISSVTNRADTIQLKTLEGLNLPATSCITVKKPVYTAKAKKELALHAELVEMECFWAAKLCKDKGAELYSVRIVSDNCDTNLSDYFHFRAEPTHSLLKAQKELADLAASIVKLLS